MNRANMRTHFLRVMQEASGATGFDDTSINEWLEEAYREIYEYENFPFDWLWTRASQTNAYTTVSATGALTSTGTTLRVVSGTNITADQTNLVVTDGTNYEFVAVTNKTGASDPYTLTLRSPGLLDSYTAITETVTGVNLYIANLMQVLEIWATKISSGVITRQFLEPLSTVDKDNTYPNISNSGTPTHYYVQGDAIFIYPIPDAAWNFEVTYIAQQSALADATELGELPSRYHYMVPERAAMIAIRQDFRSENPAALQFADSIEKRQERILRDMIQTQLRKNGGNAYPINKNMHKNLPGFSL